MADDIKIVGLSSKKSGGTNWKVISAIIGIIVLSVGVIAGIMLVRQNQNIEEKALECSAGGSMCPDPNNPSLLRDCSTGETFPNDSLCDIPGEVDVCGTTASNARQYCCPSAGGAWTTNMSACSCVATGPTNLTVENISDTSVKLKWTPGTGGTQTRLWVSKNADPTGGCSTGGAANCIVGDQKFSMAITEHTLSGLTANTKYYWRMMTSAGSGCDASTSVLNFTTTSGTSSTATPTGSATATATATSTSTSSSKTATPTATSTTKATSTSTSSSKTATPTSKASSTATAKATGSATAFPVPETGAEWPTVIGAGFGIIMLLVSLALAL